MELAELTAYAKERYHVEEQHKWESFPGFSVICHPETGKWVALLMRQWSVELGEEIERCDLKCGGDVLKRPHPDYLAAPIRMRGVNWVSIAFNAQTERSVVFRLFDQAIAPTAQHGYTVILGSQLPADAGPYRETPLPLSMGAHDRPAKEQPPEQLRELHRLFDYRHDSPGERAKDFHRQAVFMRDYEDDAPWAGHVYNYYPVYQDLTQQQLRGYFSWRTKVRRGEFRPIDESACYLYLYELLNGVGADSPGESLKKMREFERGYLDSCVTDERMRKNLHRWMLEFAVINELPATEAAAALDPTIAARDEAIAALRDAPSRSDDDVFAALCHFGGKNTAKSPVAMESTGRGKRLFCDVWRAALAYQRDGKGLFELCFGKMVARKWFPLANAVYFDLSEPGDREYELNACRRYRRVNGTWLMEAHEKLFFDRLLYKGFLHGADAALRRYLKTGRYLRERADEEWVAPYVGAVIEADRKALAEAARPKVSLDLSGLDRIRADAATTREALLTDEERADSGLFDGGGPNLADVPRPAEPAAEPEPAAVPGPAAVPEPEPKAAPEPPAPAAAAQLSAPAQREARAPAGPSLDQVHLEVLRDLLNGGDAAGIMKGRYLMPSVVADSINEYLFDEFGDTVLLCENDTLMLVDDYREELEQLLGDVRDGRA